MYLKKTFKKKNYIKINKRDFYSPKKNRECPIKIDRYIIILVCCIIFCLIIYKFFIKKNQSIISNEKIYYDKYEVYKYNAIKDKLLNIGDKDCSVMWANQREFLNGLVRKFKPKKFVEIGVRKGGSSIIILNAMEDFKNSHLYSIDINPEEKIGKCVREYFPDLMKKWTIYKGDIATEYMEKIGDDIDMLFIDTAHYEPGEILDFLMVLPFLKENAVVIFHDIANQITRAGNRDEFAPYIIYNAIRGKKILPSGDNILTQDIGAIILDNNQKLYYHDYFRLLGGQWQYFPKENQINQVKNFIQKYYDKDCLTMLEETVNFNRKFVKNHPKNAYNKYISG